jgi:hypothetical protein
MITNPALHVHPSHYEQENRLTLRVTAELNKLGHRFQRWFGAISTTILCAAALAPNAFGIPLSVQPWVFLTSIFWSFAFCAGVFDR